MSLGAQHTLIAGDERRRNLTPDMWYSSAAANAETVAGRGWNADTRSMAFYGGEGTPARNLREIFHHVGGSAACIAYQECVCDLRGLPRRWDVCG
jgi:hypothetical protein